MSKKILFLSWPVRRPERLWWCLREVLSETLADIEQTQERVHEKKSVSDTDKLYNRYQIDGTVSRKRVAEGHVLLYAPSTPEVSSASNLRRLAPLTAWICLT